MAMFVQYASCSNNNRAVRLLGMGRNSYLSIFAYPPCITGPRQRLAYKGPEITLRHISQVLRSLRQLRSRDLRESQIPNTKSSIGGLPAKSCPRVQSRDRRCVSCFRKHRKSNIKLVG